MDLIALTQLGVFALVVIVQSAHIHKLGILCQVNGLFLTGAGLKGIHLIAADGGHQHIADGDAALTFLGFLGMDRLGAVAVLVYHQAQNPGHLGIDVVCHLLAAGLDSHLLALMGHAEHIISVGIGHSGGFFLGIAPLAFQIIVNTRLQITVYHIDGADLSVHIILGIDLVAHLHGRDLALILTYHFRGIIDLYILGDGTGQHLGFSASGLGKADGDLIALDLIHIVPGAEMAAAVHIVGGDHIQNFLILAQLHTTEAGGIQHIDLVKILRPAGEHHTVACQLDMIDTVGIRLTLGFRCAGFVVKVPAEAILIHANTAGNKHIAHLTSAVGQGMDLVTVAKVCILTTHTGAGGIDDLAILAEQGGIFRSHAGAGQLLGIEHIAADLHHTGVAGKHTAFCHLGGMDRLDHIAVFIEGQAHTGGIEAVHLAGNLIVTGLHRNLLSVAQHLIGIESGYIRFTGGVSDHRIVLAADAPIQVTGLCIGIDKHSQNRAVLACNHGDLVLFLNHTGDTAGNALRSHIVDRGFCGQLKGNIITAQRHRGVTGHLVVCNFCNEEFICQDAAGKLRGAQIIHRHTVFIKLQTNHIQHIDGGCQFVVSHRNAFLYAVCGKDHIHIAIVADIADIGAVSEAFAFHIPIQTALPERFFPEIRPT